MIRSAARRVALVLTACLLCAGLEAATYVPMSDADLLHAAPLIVRASVQSVATRLEDLDGRTLPFTLVSLQRLETLKGTPVPPIFTVRLAGGTAEGLSWWVPGMPDFAPGREVVLVLGAMQGHPGQFRLTELALSKFDLVTDESGRRFAVRPAFAAEEDLQLAKTDASPIAQSARERGAVVARDAESFLAALRALRRGEAIPEIAYAEPAGGFVFDPGTRHTDWVNIGGGEPNNAGFRWFWDTGESPTAAVSVNGTQTNLAMDDLACGSNPTCFLQNAIDGWHGVAGTDVRITGPGSSGPVHVNLDAPTSQDGGVAWSTPFGCSGGVLGLGGPDASPLRGPYRGDDPFVSIVAGTVSMRKCTCATGYPGKVFKTAVMHELGHTLGLGHPDQDVSIHSTTDPSTWLTAVMTSSIPQSTPSTPQTDDIQGIQYLYGTAAPAPAPAANFSFSPSSPNPGVSVSFTDTSMNSPTGWHWDFGDGESSTDHNPSHTFLSAGSFAVKLYAGNFGGTGIATKTVVVTGGAPSVCVADPSTLCLASGRFRVTADWEKTDGTKGKGTAVSLTPDTGYFWFFSADNIEVVTKVLPFCADPFNTIWVFAAGLTDVKTTLSYTDTKNGTVVQKLNPQGTPFVPVLDTKAFKTCP